MGRSAADDGPNGFHKFDHEYRADGMRTYKSVGTSVSGYTNTLTRHDAQMPFELETLKPDGTVTATREALGARGVDAEESVSGTWSGATRTLGTSTIAYPIYDGHGNRVCTLSRYGTGSWTTDSPRFVDAWGTMRTGSATGGSTMRCCASLGHLQDDESGLIYMRARYYEPGCGRFISEDPGMDGANWCTYAGNHPTDVGDRTGCSWDPIEQLSLLNALDTWILALRLSPTLAKSALTWLSFFNTCTELGTTLSIDMSDRIKRTSFNETLQAETLTNALGAGPISGGGSALTKNIVGFFAGYSAALYMAGWLAGVWGGSDLFLN